MTLWAKNLVVECEKGEGQCRSGQLQLQRTIEAASQVSQLSSARQYGKMDIPKWTGMRVMVWWLVRLAITVVVSQCSRLRGSRRQRIDLTVSELRLDLDLHQPGSSCKVDAQEITKTFLVGHSDARCRCLTLVETAALTCTSR